jgi:hypothetical protein
LFLIPAKSPGPAGTKKIPPDLWTGSKALPARLAECIPQPIHRPSTDGDSSIFVCISRDFDI